MTSAFPLPARVFIGAARAASHLPAFRGRTRLLLELYRLLRLPGRHLQVETELRTPTAFRARLYLDSWLQRVAFLTGGYEADTVRFLLDLHSAGGHRGYLLDVGANVGLISIPFALLAGARDCSVVAVEAVPDNVLALECNLRLNGLADAVKVVPVALGEIARTAFIQVEGDLTAGQGSGTANILPDGSTYECVRQEIRVERLDSLCEGQVVPDGCSVIKIDADGYDLKVLEGAVEFVSRCRPVIFGEFSAHCMSWHSQGLSDVIAFAGRTGYEVWLRTHPEWRFTEEVGGRTFDQDLLLVPVEQRDRFARFLRTAMTT